MTIMAFIKLTSSSNVDIFFENERLAKNFCRKYNSLSNITINQIVEQFQGSGSMGRNIYS